MPWTEAARREYRRETKRYASDLTAEEWALVAPFLPLPRRIGRPRKVDLREVMNAVLYMGSIGCQWASQTRLPCYPAHPDKFASHEKVEAPNHSGTQSVK